MEQIKFIIVSVIGVCLFGSVETFSYLFTGHIVNPFILLLLVVAFCMALFTGLKVEVK